MEKDGPNFLWKGPGTMGPVEKYARIYGKNPEKMMEQVSAKGGVLQAHIDHGYARCGDDRICRHLQQTDANYRKEAEPIRCAYGAGWERRRYHERGVCVPFWMGTLSL